MANIIIIDDNSFAVSLIKKALIKMGHTVVGCGYDGNKAIQLYKKHRPDLLLLDLTMPNKDGREALIEILNNHKNARIVILSSLVNKNVINECLDNGAAGYIVKSLKFNKPQVLREFQQIIEDALSCKGEDIK